MSKVAESPVRKSYLKEIGLALAAVAVVAGLAVAFWPRPDAETLSQRARSAFMARRYDQAEADMNQVLKLRKPTAYDSMVLAQLLIMKGQNDPALAMLELIPDDHPMAGQARLQAGQIELRRSRFMPAEAYFNRALKIDPKMERAYRELIYIYGMQLRRPELNATFRKLCEISPLTYSEVFLWCLTRAVIWDALEIVETRKKCLEADPNDRWAKLGIAEGFRELSRLDEAEAMLATLPESDPAARASRVRVALDQGKSQVAETLLEGGPTDDVDLALLRGRFALARGDGAEAVRQFRIAYKLAPTLREAILGLGQALKNTGDAEAAAPLTEELRKHERLGALIQVASIEKNRDDPVLMKNLGAACADLNRLYEARAWYNLAVTRDPLDTQAQEGLSRVKERLKAGK